MLKTSSGISAALTADRDHYPCLQVFVDLFRRYAESYSNAPSELDFFAQRIDEYNTLLELIQESKQVLQDLKQSQIAPEVNLFRGEEQSDEEDDEDNDKKASQPHS